MFKIGDKVVVTKQGLKTTGKTGIVYSLVFGFSKKLVQVRVNIGGYILAYNPDSLGQVVQETKETFRLAHTVQMLKDVFDSYEDALEALKKWGLKLADGSELSILKVVDTYATTRSVKLEKK